MVVPDIELVSSRLGTSAVVFIVMYDEKQMSRVLRASLSSPKPFSTSFHPPKLTSAEYQPEAA